MAAHGPATPQPSHPLHRHRLGAAADGTSLRTMVAGRPGKQDPIPGCRCPRYIRPAGVVNTFFRSDIGLPTASLAESQRPVPAAVSPSHLPRASGCRSGARCAPPRRRAGLSLAKLGNRCAASQDAAALRPSTHQGMGSELLSPTDRGRRREPRTRPLDARPPRRQGLRGRRDWPEDVLPPQRRVRPRQHREELQRRSRDHRGRPHRPLPARSRRREPLPPRRWDHQGRRDSVEPSSQDLG